MKKIISLLLIVIMPISAFADVLGSAQDATNQTGSMIGTLLFIVVTSVWVLPIVFGVMVYSGQKKKAEQQHEEVGIKAAVFSLVAIIIGAAASYYIVGTIGNLAKGGSGTADLKAGNTYFLAPLFNKGKENITTGAGK